MKENISELTKIAVNKFNKLSESEKLYSLSILLNHIYNGLINDGNFSDEEEAIETDKLVLKGEDLGIDNIMGLATSLLLLATDKEKILVNPNGIDIEPYVKNKENLNIKEFYNLNYEEKIDYLAEVFYIISEIKESEKCEINFYDIIKELLDYSNYYFPKKKKNNIELF